MPLVVSATPEVPKQVREHAWDHFHDRVLPILKDQALRNQSNPEDPDLISAIEDLPERTDFDQLTFSQIGYLLESLPLDYSSDALSYELSQGAEGLTSAFYGWKSAGIYLVKQHWYQWMSICLTRVIDDYFSNVVAEFFQDEDDYGFDLEEIVHVSFDDLPEWVYAAVCGDQDARTDEDEIFWNNSDPENLIELMKSELQELIEEKSKELFSL